MTWQGIKGTTFQFHNGSIKSLEGYLDLNTWETFQFHNGSIKRYATANADWLAE